MNRADARTYLLRHGAIRRACLILLALAAIPTALPAQDGNEWVGKRIILQFNSVLRVGNQVVDNQKRVASGRGGERASSRIYRVEQVNGPWLWIKAENEGASGWIQAAEVIQYQAIDYFTNQIRANPASPVRPLRAPTLQRHHDELHLSVPQHVAPANPMQRRLVVLDRVDLPFALRVAAEPLQGAGLRRGGRVPTRTQGEVDLAVAVDVVGLEADVVALGLALDDRVLRPRGVLIPINGVLGDGDHVGLLVAVDIGRGDGVDDLARVGVDFLRHELGEVGGRGWAGEEEREQGDALGHGAGLGRVEE